METYKVYTHDLLYHALEQGSDKDNTCFLECMDELYRLESEYGTLLPSSEQITAYRQGLKIKEIMNRFRGKLDATCQNWMLTNFLFHF